MSILKEIGKWPLIKAAESKQQEEEEEEEVLVDSWSEDGCDQTNF